MAEAGNWCLIESDPAVFTELVREFGCKGLQVEELYALDDEIFRTLGPVHGLVFLFKWLDDNVPSGSIVKDSRLDEIFFARQVIQNACASQAIINCLLNLDVPDIEIGKVLSDFKAFTAGFDAATKGLSLSNQEVIRKAHNSFSRQQMFEIDVKSKEKDDDAFHFVTYIPFKGRIYELDGLQEGPVDLGRIPDGQDWIRVVKPIIEARMQRYSAGEIHFNLMAIITDRKLVYQRQLEELAQGTITDEAAQTINELQCLIANEDQKRQQFKKENARRKHNYIPFIIELLKILAKEGKLVPLVMEAKEKAEQKAKAAKRPTDSSKPASNHKGERN